MARARIQTIVRQFRENGLKLLLENSANVRELFDVEEVDLREAIDFARMTVERTTFVQRDYRHVETDLVLRAPLRRPGKGRARWITIYILIELQSEPDPWMSLRVLEYVVQIYKAQVRAWDNKHPSRAGLRLQPVLPIVFYTGTRRWDSLGQLADLVEVGELLGKRIPTLEPHFVNLRGVPASQLESKGGFFGWVLRLVQEREARPAEFQALLRRAVEHLEEMPPAELQRWRELLSYLAAMVYHVRGRSEQEALQAEIEASARSDESWQEVSAMVWSMADEMKAQGRKEGKREEAVRARQQTLLRQLRRRFDKLPAKTVAAVEAANSVEQLDTWLDRFVTATTLDEVGIQAN